MTTKLNCIKKLLERFLVILNIHYELNNVTVEIVKQKFCQKTLALSVRFKLSDVSLAEEEATILVCIRFQLLSFINIINFITQPNTFIFSLFILNQ